jgi:pimeloyl-ACP methyl ester carboxylesterase
MDTSSTSFYHKTPNGTNVHFTQTGNPSGPLIILLHGLGGSTETFRPILQSLLPQINRLACVDFEGFGRTTLSSPDTTLSLPRYVDDLEHLVASLQGPPGGSFERKLLFIGHSLGAIVSMHYASRHPDQVRGLALLGAGRSVAHIPAARERMLGLAARTRTEGIQAAAEIAATSNFPLQGTVEPELRQSVREAVASCDAESYARACEAIAGLDHLDPDYSLISAPTLFLAGSGDIISPPEISVGLQELIGDNAWVNIFEGVGHQMILQNLEVSIEAIETLLEKVDK